MKGTFNQGWWNCFESFAAELLVMSGTNGYDTCLTVLRGAGISAREAESWLNRYNGVHHEVEDVVRDYLNSQ